MKKLTTFQESILKRLKEGQHMDFTEGENFKVWFILDDGGKEFIRRDSARTVINRNIKNLTVDKTIYWTK